MPPPSGREVFPVLEDAFFPGFGVAVSTIDPVCNVPYKVLQGLQVVGVSARVILCVSVGRGKECQISRLLWKRAKT